MTKAQFSNLGYRGFFGITASNKSNLRPYKSIDLVRAAFWNLSPKFYRKPEPVKETIYQAEVEATDLLEAKREVE